MARKQAVHPVLFAAFVKLSKSQEYAAHLKLVDKIAKANHGTASKPLSILTGLKSSPRAPITYEHVHRLYTFAAIAMEHRGAVKFIRTELASLLDRNLATRGHPPFTINSFLGSLR